MTDKSKNNKSSNFNMNLVLSPDALQPSENSNYNTFLLIDLEKHVQDQLSKSITKTQLRNLFDTIRKCESNQEMKMLKPRLMYTAGRVQGSSKQFIKQVIDLIAELENENDFKKIIKFMEAVLAYHKYHANK